MYGGGYMCVGVCSIFSLTVLSFLPEVCEVVGGVVIRCCGCGDLFV